MKSYLERKEKTMYEILRKNSEYTYDNKRINRLIIRCKRTADERKTRQYKKELFIALSKIIVKAVNNFFNLIKDIDENKVVHTKEDISSECFYIMNKCVESLKISALHKFCFYLNTSLNRGIYRLYEKNYKKHFNVIRNSFETENILNNRCYTHHFDCSEIDLKCFTEDELMFIKFKISGQKLNLFLKRNKMLATTYYEISESVVSKLKSLYGEDEDLKRFFKEKQEVDA